MAEIKEDCGCGPKLPVKSCGLPDKPPTCVTVVPPPPCPEPPCEPCPVTFIPYVEPPCEPECGPCSAPPECNGCNWSAECLASVPPPIPCAPINAGWGQYDGGFMHWARHICCDDPCALESKGSDFVIREYTQHNWHHVLDLSTFDEIYTGLLVRKNGMINDMSAQEFIALTYKIARLGVCFGILQPATPIPVPSLFGLTVAQTGINSEGIPEFGLSITYAGQPVGSPFPLEATWDATGEPTTLAFPATVLPPLS